MRRWVKNILIVGLVVLCVYQTGRLWFDAMPNLNFLYAMGFTNPGTAGHEEAIARLRVPMRILVSEGAYEFVVVYSNVESTGQFASAIPVISQVLRSGERGLLVYGDEINWGDYLSGQVLILDYGFSMPATVFATAFGESHGGLSSRISHFDMVIFTPRPQGILVVFADTLSETPALGEFLVRSSQTIDFTKPDRGHNLVYIASEPHGINFGRLIFMPNSNVGGFAYTMARTIGPLDDVSINTQRVADLVMPFFDNQNAVRNDFLEDTREFVFADTYTILTYRDSLFIDFQSWGGSRRRDRNGQASFEESFSEAYIFMRDRDLSIANEIYLSGFDYDGGSFRFYFNYIFNDLPVVLDERLKNILGMDAAIEITVENGRVSRYRRFVMGLAPAHVGREPVMVEINYQILLSTLESLGFDDHGISAGSLAYTVRMDGTTGLVFSFYYEGVQNSIQIR